MTTEFRMPAASKWHALRAFSLGLAAQIAVGASAAAQSTQAAGSQLPALMDQQKESALALSACPPSVASKAAYVPDEAGYSRSGIGASTNACTNADIGPFTRPG